MNNVKNEDALSFYPIFIIQTNEKTQHKNSPRTAADKKELKFYF